MSDYKDEYGYLNNIDLILEDARRQKKQQADNYDPYWDEDDA